MTSQSFRDLAVWRESHRFVLEVYRVTESLPKHEMFGLTSQLRRAAFSIPANIAEGFKRRGTADKIRFYNISQGSIEESRYFLILASDLNYMSDGSELLELIDSVARMLHGLIKSVSNSTGKRPSLNG